MRRVPSPSPHKASEQPCLACVIGFWEHRKRLLAAALLLRVQTLFVLGPKYEKLGGATVDLLAPLNAIALAVQAHPNQSR